MIGPLRHAILIAVSCLAFWSIQFNVASAHDMREQCDCPYEVSQLDLFYNFYAGPSICGGVPAQLYISPRPTPPLVGHTYITYQPLMPHEFIYQHQRAYARRHSDGGGITRTFIKWR